ncbi:MAG TPA: glycosyltransferase [Anaerovoracaceae bacterium]|uniref:glycosyltransferase n=1 Tax=Paraburkholderia terricola TaxID=169427 RepID=UPI002BC10C47|nr:glycosyltransferase [Anaerovoracaceae bacterium]
MRKAFVLLWAEISVEHWKKAFEKGLRPDRSPYGYHYLEEAGFDVLYSQSVRENYFSMIFRKLISRVFRADLVHALRNIGEMAKSDYIFTHTDRETFSVLLLRIAFPWLLKAKIVCQIIWTPDILKQQSKFGARLVGAVLRKADLVITLSSQNREWLNQLDSRIQARSVKFGVCRDSFSAMEFPAIRDDSTLRILAIGNDEHRDWRTFCAALSGASDVHVRVLSRTFKKSVGSYPDQWGIESANSLSEVKDAYAWADIVVVPLKSNMHASGITCVLEAAFLGVPVIVANTGGLTDYFEEGEVMYYETGNAESLRSQVRKFATDISARRSYQRAAFDRACTETLTSKNYIDQQVSLILARDAIGGA